MTSARLIAIDWGTTSLRAYLVADNGAIVDRHQTADGILSVRDGGFEDVLERTLGRLAGGDGDVPIVMSGMIGSRQGWAEAPYTRCPAGLDAVASSLMTVRFGCRCDMFRDVFIVPGLQTTSANGVPDVMRGEETQILGAMIAHDLGEGVIVLPGTHSKWAALERGQIMSFATYMTGEIFAALCGHTILGRLMRHDESGMQEAEFARGVAASAQDGGPGALMHHVFSARTLCLAGDLPETGVSSYLSGLLIGFELRAAVRDIHQPLYVMAGSTLAELYAKAAGIAGLTTVPVDNDCIVRGALAIAERAGH